MLRKLAAILFIFYQVSAQQGSNCSDPFEITTLPFSQDGTTVGFPDSFSFPDSMCPGVITASGSGSPDNVYTFVGTDFIDYTFTVHNPTFAAVLYLFADCANVGSSCRGADNQASPQLVFSPRPNTTYYLVVDGTSPTSAGGTYTLTVETANAFFSSATTADTNPTTVNTTMETTEPPKSQGGDTFTPGENCAHPLVVDSIPYENTGDTAIFLNYYTIPAGACPYQAGSEGAGSPDNSYSFTPNVTGIYTVTLSETTFDSVLSVVQDCNDILNTCLEGRDNVGAGAVESFALNFTAGTTYFILVDGYSNDAAVNVSGNYKLSVVEGGSLTVPTSVAPTSAQPTFDTTSATSSDVITSSGAPASGTANSNAASGARTDSTAVATNTLTSQILSNTDGNNEVSSVGVLKPLAACIAAAFFYL